MTVLKQALNSHPGNRDILLALVSFSRLAGDAAGRARLCRAARGHHAGRPEFGGTDQGVTGADEKAELAAYS